MILEGIGEDVIDRLRNDIKNKSLVSGYPAPDASGALVNSLRYEATDTNLKVFANDYIYELQFGRKPGIAPPRAVIRKWITDKGILPQPNDKGKTISLDSLAFLIQRKIGEKGTLIYQQGGSDLLSSIINTEAIENWKSRISFEAINLIRSEILAFA